MARGIDDSGAPGQPCTTSPLLAPRAQCDKCPARAGWHCCCVPLRCEQCVHQVIIPPRCRRIPRPRRATHLTTPLKPRRGVGFLAQHVSAGFPSPQRSKVPKGRETSLTCAYRCTLRSTHKSPITRHVIEPVPVRTIRLGNLARVATFSESRVRDDHPVQIYEPRAQSERSAHKTHQNDHG